MNLLCEGCGATPIPEQKICRFCGTKFDFSKVDATEKSEKEIPENETDVAVENEENKAEVSKSEEAQSNQDVVADEKAEPKVALLRENEQPTKTEAGLFKKLFGKK